VAARARLGLHDFNLTSAQRLSDFRALVDRAYGGAESASTG